MATSTIPAFKTALLAQLQARPGLNGVMVTWGFPVGAPAAEWLFIGNANGDQASASIGRLQREETYEVATHVSVLRAGRDIQGAVTRAWAIANEVENELRANVTMNATVRVAEIFGPIASEEFFDGEKCEGRVTLTIRCHARI